ncbi:acyl carrier protein [Rhizorhabdus argentea]|uniref:acyl carrier protein n=1 Tax=Rhizorhabdus argentea TaxID=1387174 RepID=UPI0030EB9ACA
MRKPYIYEKLTEIFRDIFDDEDIALSDETTAVDVDGWDSLSNIQLILAVESAFRIRLSAAQVASLATLGDLVSIIDAKIGQSVA